MTDQVQKLYWDADIFIAYLNNEPNRAPTIEALLDKAKEKQNFTIVTSVLTKVEVSWLAVEKLNRILMPDEFIKIDSLLENYHVLETIEFNDIIASISRDLMRQGMEAGGKRLRTNDAIHLASAVWVDVTEFNTYNLKDYRIFDQFTKFPIREPITAQPLLL